MKTRCEQMAVCQAKPCKPECSTGNAFTGATNSIDWGQKHTQSSGGAVNSARNDSQVYLPNSRQQQTYSAAGLPK